MDVEVVSGNEPTVTLAMSKAQAIASEYDANRRASCLRRTTAPPGSTMMYDDA